MNAFKRLFILLIISAFLFSCDEEDPLAESRPLIKFNIQLTNNNFDVCSTMDITYLIEEKGNQTSYDVANGSLTEININVRKGEFIGVTAFDTDDSSNTVLASANIPSDTYSETEVNRLKVYYTECPVIDKILWVTR